MVGWSLATAEAKSEAPMLSPADMKAVAPGAAASRSFSMFREEDCVGVDASVEIVDAQELQVNGGRCDRCGRQVQAHHHGIVVAGPELVRRIVVGHIVVIPAVLQRDGLHGVDVPDVGSGDHALAQPATQGRGPGNPPGHRTGRSAWRCRRVPGLLVLVDVTGSREDVDGVLLGVGVEVAHQEDLVRALRGLQFVGKCEKGFGLLGAGKVRGALALVGVLRSGGRALGLEVVGDGDELLVISRRQPV